MAKKNTFGKFIAFTTSVAAIGGVCYVFRNQIKESALYQKTMDSLSHLLDTFSTKFSKNTEDDFYFDDDDDFFDEDISTMFSDTEKKNREYTSITIHAGNEDSPEKNANGTTETTISGFQSIPSTIEISDELSDDISEEQTNTASSQADNEEEIPTGYEYEGLSDVSEDPDVLAEQDKLDF